MELKGSEAAVVALALASVMFTAGYFTGRSASGDISVTVERTELSLPSGAESGEGVNINTASEAELRDLPGIGQVLAGRIVEYRREHGPFSCLEELMSVPGIGASLVEGLEGSAYAGEIE